MVHMKVECAGEGGEEVWGTVHTYSSELENLVGNCMAQLTYKYLQRKLRKTTAQGALLVCMKHGSWMMSRRGRPHVTLTQRLRYNVMRSKR